MTIPLVIQAVNATGAEFKDTTRRFVAQALLSTVRSVDANVAVVGNRAFQSYLYSLPPGTRVPPGARDAFIKTAGEMLATKATAPLISPHLIGLLAGILALWIGQHLWGDQ